MTSTPIHGPFSEEAMRNAAIKKAKTITPPGADAGAGGPSDAACEDAEGEEEEPMEDEPEEIE